MPSEVEESAVLLRMARKYSYNDARSLPLYRFNALIRRRSGRGMIVNDAPTIWPVAEDQGEATMRVIFGAFQFPPSKRNR